VRHKKEAHAGLHQGIVEPDVFRRVQKALGRNGHGGGPRNKHGALLCGLLRCAACDCAMGHAFTTKGNRRYRYYVCQHAQKWGRKECPAPSLPAYEIERFVANEIKCIGRDPSVLAETVSQVRKATEEKMRRLEREERGLRRRVRSERQKATGAGALEQVREVECRLTEVQDELARAQSELLSDDDVERALAEFDAVWDALAPREQARVLSLLVEQVDYDGRAENVAITFRPSGIKAWASELEEAVA
jgi:site-specific DNA recombinase